MLGDVAGAKSILKSVFVILFRGLSVQMGWKWTVFRIDLPSMPSIDDAET